MKYYVPRVSEFLTFLKKQHIELHFVRPTHVDKVFATRAAEIAAQERCILVDYVSFCLRGKATPAIAPNSYKARGIHNASS